MYHVEDDILWNWLRSLRILDLELGQRVLLYIETLAQGDWLAVGNSSGGSWLVESFVHLSVRNALTFHRHIFTGIAAYFNLTWAIWLRYCLDDRQDEVELSWPSVLSSVPLVVRKRGKNGTGNSRRTE